MLRTNHQKALMYAGYMALKRELEKDGELDPKTYIDVSGATLNITFPNGTIVERDGGTHGDGTIFKKAIQNLYGYPVMALMAWKLSKFNQWPLIRKAILEAIAEVLKRKKGDTSVREQIVDDFPECIPLMEALQSELPIPPRKEETPRVMKDTGLPPTLTARWPK